MIRKLIGWCIENRTLTVLSVLILLAGGILAMLSTPLEALPDITPTEVIIKTSYPGQAPQVVQDQVTYPLRAVQPSELTVH